MKLIPNNYHCTRWEKIEPEGGSPYYVCAVSRKAKNGQVVADQVIVTQEEMERNELDAFGDLLQARFKIAVASIKAILRTMPA